MQSARYPQLQRDPMAIKKYSRQTNLRTERQSASCTCHCYCSQLTAKGTNIQAPIMACQTSTTGYLTSLCSSYCVVGPAHALSHHHPIAPFNLPHFLPHLHPPSPPHQNMHVCIHTNMHTLLMLETAKCN